MRVGVGGQVGVGWVLVWRQFGIGLESVSGQLEISLKSVWVVQGEFGSGLV